MKKSILFLFMYLCLAFGVANAEMNLSLKKGWNLISFPQQPDSKALQQLTENDAIESIWSLSNANQTRQWLRSPTLYQGQPSITQLNLHHAYWVKATYALNLTIAEAQSAEDSTPLTLQAGWNFIGFALNEAVDYRDFLAGIQFDQLWRFNAESQSYQAIIPSTESLTPVTEDFTKIEPHVGYWINVNATQKLGPVLSTIAPADNDVSPYAEGQYGERIRWALSVNDQDFGDDGYFDNSYTQRAFDFGDEVNTQYLTIRNVGSGALNYTLEIVNPENSPWLTISQSDDPTNFTTHTQITGQILNTPQRIAIHVDRTSLPPHSRHQGILRLSSNAKNDPKREFTVHMQVTDLTGDYQVQVKINTINHQGIEKKVDLYNPKFALTMTRNNQTGELRARMNKSRNLLLPKDYLLVGNTVNNPQHNFTLSGSIELPPKTYTFTSNTIVRDISFVGTRAAAHDNLSDTSLLGEYEEIIHGMLPYPIKIQGTFIATRRSKQTEDFLIKATDPDEYSTETQTSTNNSTIYRYHKKIQQRLLITKAQVKLGIKHDFPEQLSISLINPQGETLKLRSQGKQTPRTDTLDYEAKHQAIDSLEQLANHYTNGTWTIQVTDHLPDSFEPELTQYKLILTGNNVYSLSITFPSNLDGKLVMINGCGSSYFASISNGKATFKGLSECRYQIVILDPLYPDTYPVSIAGKDKVLDLSTGTKAVTPQYKDTLDFTFSPRIGNVPQTIYVTALSQLPAGHYFGFRLYMGVGDSIYDYPYHFYRFSGRITSTKNQVAFNIRYYPGSYALKLRLWKRSTSYLETDKIIREVWKPDQAIIIGQPKSTSHTLTYRIGGSAGINQQPLIKQYAYDSATFDIDRFPFISTSTPQAGPEDSDGFNGEIDSISGTNKSNTQLVEEGGVYIYKYIPDGRIQQPVGDNNKHYRINISIGQFISGISVDNNYRLSNTPFSTTSTTSQ